MAKAKLYEWHEGGYCFITNGGKRTMVYIDANGINYDESKVKTPIRRDRVDEAKKILDVLKKINHKSKRLQGSYFLKHAIERSTPSKYITNGEMIIAALEHGLNIYERDDTKGPNCDISLDYSMASMHRSGRR